MGSTLIQCSTQWRFNINYCELARYLGCIDQLVCKAFRNGLDVTESRFPSTCTWECAQHSNMGMCTTLKHGNVDNTQTWECGQHLNMGMCTTLTYQLYNSIYCQTTSSSYIQNIFLILHNQKLQTIKNYGLNTQDEFWSYAFPLYETEKLLFCTTQCM